jgi:hypothetical protein
MFIYPGQMLMTFSPANRARYEAYLNRAVFYNVVKRTVSGLLGNVFLVDPVITVPTLLNSVVKDATGSGITLVQLSQQVEDFVLKYGRAGILSDFPTVTPNEKITVLDQLQGKVRPTITAYAPWNVINWRTKTRGGKVILSLVVLCEGYEDSDNGFASVVKPQYRVLRLGENDVYQQEIWRKVKDGGAYEMKGSPVSPLDSRGQFLREIPFTFVGAIDNSPTIDPSPILDMVELNLAHYHNSADYEESVYMTGQATPVVTGLTQQWVDVNFKNGVELGSRAVIALPVGASAELLQMQERTAGFEAMEHKEAQMKALGAKLVESQTVQRTATESSQDNASDNSVLTTITNNVSAAFQWSLEWCGIFAGSTTITIDANTADTSANAIEFKLNTEFDIVNMTAEDINTSTKAWKDGAITFNEMRIPLRKAGLATEDDNAAKAAIDAEALAEGKMQLELSGGMPTFGA